MMGVNRIWTIGSVVVMAVVLAAGWFLGIQPQLAAADAANQARIQVQSQNATSQAVLAQLKKDYQNIDQVKQQLASLRQKVPTQVDASGFVTELNGLAGLYQVTLKSISVGDAKPYTPPVAPPTPAPSRSPAPSGTPGTAAKAPGVIGATNPLITSANFIVIPVQLTVTGSYGNVLDFVSGLQTGQRLFLVSAFSSGASTVAGAPSTNVTTVGTVDSTVGGFMYVLVNH